jgi:exopolysaccharide biosynthesis polyprenyl glycosylphosphotransferase
VTEPCPAVGEVGGADSAPTGETVAELEVRPPRRSRSRAAVVLATILADVIAVTAGYAVAGYAIGGRVLAVSLITVPVWIGCFSAYGLYDQRRLVAPSEEAGRLFHGVTVATIATVMAAFLLKVTVTRRSVAIVWLSCLLTVGLIRLARRKVIHLLHIRGYLGTRVLIVGSNDEGRSIGRTLLRQRWTGYRPLGFVQTGLGREDVGADPIPVVGSLPDLPGIVRSHNAEAVILASTALDPGQLSDLCAGLDALGVETRISAGLPQVAASRVNIEPLDGVAMLSVRPNQLSAQQSAVKRVVDVAASLLLLVLLAPVMAVIALVVRLTSTGPIIFRQIRVGEGGTPFVIYKFRTMVADAELLRSGILDLNEADGPLFKVSRDPRVTGIGRFLRRFGLDELPQLYNVIRGEMSLVGPRPPLRGETERYDEWVRGRLRVKPGMTGLWQVSGGHELAFDDYVRYDLFYIANWSLALDLYILVRTVPALFRRRGLT